MVSTTLLNAGTNLTRDDGSARGTQTFMGDLSAEADPFIGIHDFVYSSLLPPKSFLTLQTSTQLPEVDSSSSLPTPGEAWVVGVGVHPAWVGVLVLVIKGVVMAAVIIASVLGNLLVIVSVARYHKLRVITNYFVVSMALADMLVALMAMVFNASVQLTNTWLFGPIMCDLWNSMDVYFSTVSILHLCCISIDRYTAIVQPLDYPLRMTGNTVTLMLAVAWVSPVFISVLPIFLGWYTTQEQLELMATTPGLCDFKVNLAYALVSSSMSFWIPGIIMLVMYFRIYREADRQEMMVFRSTVAALLLNKHLHINGMTRGSVKITDDAPSGGPMTGVAGHVKPPPPPSPPGAPPPTPGAPPGAAPGIHSNGVSAFEPPPRSVPEACLDQSVGTRVDLAHSDDSTPTPSPGSTPVARRGRLEGKRRFMGVGVRKSSTGVGPDAIMSVTTAGEAKKKQASLHKMKRERKAAKTLGIIVSVFLLCWLPFFTWYLVSALCGQACAVPNAIVTILFWIGYFNSTLNPIIYAYFNRDFRKAFRKTLAHYGFSCVTLRRTSRLCCGRGRRLLQCCAGFTGSHDTPSSEVPPRSAFSSEYCHIEMTTVDKVAKIGAVDY